MVLLQKNKCNENFMDFCCVQVLAPNSFIKILTPELQNVTLFDDSGFGQVIGDKQGFWDRP